MSIAPNSTIYLCKDIPLNADMVNTTDYDSAETQFKDFQKYITHTLSNYTYVRKDNSIRVEIPSDELYGCNYMIYRNTNYNTKLFYSFIVDVEYVSDNVSALHYTIDDWQTWMFEAKFEQCFIEREHSKTDEVGDNIIDEGLETGEMMTTYVLRNSEWDEECLAVFSTTDPEGNDFYNPLPITNLYESARAYCGGDGSFAQAKIKADSAYWSPITTFKVDGDSIGNRINGIVDNSAGGTGAILGIIQIPYMVAQYNAPSLYAIGVKGMVSNLGNNFGSSFGGYVPHNNKLYTYPYNYITVNNGDGGVANYKWEYFDLQDGSAQFAETVMFSLSPECACSPYRYKGYNSSKGSGTKGQMQFEYNNAEALILNNFPMVSWNIDTYRAWIAGQGNKALALDMTSQAVNGTVGVVSNIASGNAMGAVTQGLSAAAGIYSNVMKKDVLKQQPPTRIGAQSGGGAGISMGTRGFTYGYTKVTEQFARIIDNYFDMYGYAQHVVDYPSFKHRKYYNYCKTINCNVRGNIPQGAVLNIQNAFDKGITIWHGGLVDVGNYSLAPANTIKG